MQPVKIKLLYGLEAAAGGALKHLIYLATHLDKDLFDITVVISNKRGGDIGLLIQKMIQCEVKVIEMPMRREIRIIKDLILIFKICRLIYKRKYTIVHAHSSKAGGIFRLAAWLCKVSFIYYTPHGFYFQGKCGLERYIYTSIEKLLGRITSHLIISENELNTVIKNNIVAEKKIYMINNAIDINEYKCQTEIDKIKNDIGIPIENFVVGAIGRLVIQKDWETYLFSAQEVIMNYPNTTFILAGEGEQECRIRDLISKLNLMKNVLLTGYVKDISKIFGVIDILVNTSIWEGLPYIFLEAMIYKKPIIATCEENREIINDGITGYILPKRDYVKIANKVITLIENKELAREMGKNCGTLLSRYSFDTFIRKHEKMYQKS